jgi:hypothetical protein
MPTADAKQRALAPGRHGSRMEAADASKPPQRDGLLFQTRIGLRTG